MSTYSSSVVGLNTSQVFQKRVFDLLISFFGLSVSWWLILAVWLAASFDTRSNGFFIQNRVGRHGKIFRVVKIKTMRPVLGCSSTVTCKGDPRVTLLGAFFRRTKLDELPQLWNILIGEMSFVGPRPDVPGFADALKGEERMILSIRPGITGPATLKYHDEENLLARQTDPDRYNRDVIWPDKIQINLEYIRDWSLIGDIRYILQTVFH